MTTVGYGDIVPKTHLGRMIAFTAAVSGSYLLSLFIIGVASNFGSLNRNEEYTLLEILIKERKEEVRQLAALIIQRMYRNHCCRKNKIRPFSKKQSFPGKGLRSNLKIKKSKVRWDLNEIEILRQMIYTTENVFNNYKSKLFEFEKFYNKLEEARIAQLQQLNQVEEVLFKIIQTNNFYHPNSASTKRISQSIEKQMILGKSLDEKIRKNIIEDFQKYQINRLSKNRNYGLKEINRFEVIFRRIEKIKKNSQKEFNYFIEIKKINTQELAEEYQDIAKDIIHNSTLNFNQTFFKSIFEKGLTQKLAQVQKQKTSSSPKQADLQRVTSIKVNQKKLKKMDQEKERNAKIEDNFEIVLVQNQEESSQSNERENTSQSQSVKSMQKQ